MGREVIQRKTEVSDLESIAACMRNRVALSHRRAEGTGCSPRRKVPSGISDPAGGDELTAMSGRRKVRARTRPNARDCVILV